MTYLDFVQSKQKTAASMTKLNEAFKNSDVAKAHALMLNLFKKKIMSGSVMLMGAYSTVIGGSDMQSYLFICYDGGHIWKSGWTLNYKVDAESSAVYSIDFFDGDSLTDFVLGTGGVKSRLSIYTMGTSVAYFIPVIAHVIDSGDFSLNEEDAKKYGDSVFNGGTKFEGYAIDFGALKYTVHEKLDPSDIDDLFRVNCRIYETEAEDERRRVSGELSKAKRDGDSDAVKQLTREYSQICKAIKGGATTIDEVRMSISRGTRVTCKPDETVLKAEETVKERKNPDQVFKELQMYVKSVIKGIQPGLICCGGPGSGKTHRIMKQLAAAGYAHGHNMYVFKGKATTRTLYLRMFEYKDKGNIIVIDDADALIGPKAPEDCINILKAALDSTTAAEGRHVTYGVAGKLLDDDGNDVPKAMNFGAGIIVITNYSVGQLDTAIRNRVFTMSIDFSTEQMLELIKELMPAIEPDTLSMGAKTKAYEYLTQLNSEGTDMEITIRSFGMCSRIFTVCEGEDGFTDEDAKSMIHEQMINMFQRGGKKF